MKGCVGVARYSKTMKKWDAVFKKLPDSIWVVETYLVWNDDGWKKVHITAADCEFLSACNIKWS